MLDLFGDDRCGCGEGRTREERLNPYVSPITLAPPNGDVDPFAFQVVEQPPESGQPTAIGSIPFSGGLANGWEGRQARRDHIEASAVEVLLGQGMSIADAVRQIGITQNTFYRWRKLYGGM